MVPSNLLLDYCLAHTGPPDPVLTELERETHLYTLSPQMLSGPVQGRLLQFLSQMLQPARILEIGTFTGYATICLAKGLQAGGLLHTIEVNDELAPIILKFIDRAGLTDKVRLHIGDAADLLPHFTEIFDLVFLDAGKLDYARHYHLAMPLLRPGGWLLADNTLWDGKVTDPATRDATTLALQAFNDMVHRDPQMENLILPVRDGLLIAHKLE